MLSIILYGRNDDHGYNYHKRLAISLNCLAELLTDPSDEIIFVDYNTSNELPTIIEAIQDTLTDKTRKLLRVFRVRGHHHAQFNTKLSVLESVARNVAIRRSNRENKWILSTNGDMVFVPCDTQSLTDTVAALEGGYYSLPRFELPENLWELSLKRLDPSWNISFLREQAPKFHLDTVVRKDGFIKYDNPGDFQLMLRKDIIEMRGFDEAMVKGWNVDSNLAKRMFLQGKMGCSIESLLKGYHCNHTHKESILHSAHRTQNSWSQFVAGPDIAVVANGSNWGLINEEIEEVFLNSSRHLDGIAGVLKEFPPLNYEILDEYSRYNQLTYSTPRIFTYLLDHLRNAPKEIDVAYIGHNEELVKMIESYLQTNHFSGKVLRSSPENASLIIFDFGFDTKSSVGQKSGRGELKIIMKSFFNLMAKKNKVDPSSKIIGININYSDFNVIFSKHLSMRLNSCITGIGYGYFPAKKRRGKAIPTAAALKKEIIFNLRYWLVRYFFNYTDRVRALALRFKLLKKP